MALIKSYISFGIGLLVMMCSVDRSLQDCNRPTDLDPNIIINPNQTTYGGYYYFDTSCQAGYDKSGPDRYYCIPGSPDDDWDRDTSPDTLSCSVAAVPCPKPIFDDDTVVITPNNSSYDTYDVITASCPTGTLQGDDQAQCQPDGTWDFATEPSCASNCQALENSNGTGSYQHSDIVTFVCDTGYSFEGSEDYTLTCDDGNWAPMVSCKSIGCLAPSIPATVSINESPPSGQYDVDSKVTLVCNGNTTPSGPEFSYCNETGGWDPNPMTLKCRDQCKTPSFDDPRIIHSSDLRKTSGQSFYDHEDIIRFSCMEGIFVDGPWKSTCHNGTWSPPIGGYRPVCKNNCTSPENMSNAGDVFRHSQGHVFECDGTPGMVRMGGPRSVCMDGVWTPRIRCALKKDLRSEL